MQHFSALTLKQLRGFAAVLRTGGVTSAAHALGLTPPAVSTQLRALEAGIGAAILARGANGRPHATRQGEELLKLAAKIEAAMSQCETSLLALAEGKLGAVNLGVVSTAKYFAPRFVALARNAQPELEIKLKVGNRNLIVDALLKGEIDLAIMGRPPADPVALAAPLGPHPHVLIAPPGHPLLRRRHIAVDELLRETFLMREPGSGTRTLGERYLDQIGHGRSYISVEFGSNETIKQGVIAGLGIALISAHTVVAELESKRLALIHAPGLPIVRRWFVVQRGPVGRSGPAVAAIAELLVTHTEDYMPEIQHLMRPTIT